MKSRLFCTLSPKTIYYHSKNTSKIHETIKTFHLHGKTYPKYKIQYKNHVFNTTADIGEVWSPATMHFELISDKTITVRYLTQI